MVLNVLFSVRRWSWLLSISVSTTDFDSVETGSIPVATCYFLVLLIRIFFLFFVSCVIDLYFFSF